MSVSTKYQSNAEMASKEELVTEEMGTRRKSKFFIYILTVLSTLGGFLFGYDTGVVSGAMLLVKKDFDITPVWHELIVSATVGAALIFSLCGGWFADRFGRKPTILLSGVIFILGSIVMGASQNKEILLLGRLIVGMAIGITSVVVPLYTEEMNISDTAPMPSFIALVAFGQFIASCVCGIFSETPQYGWSFDCMLKGLESMSVPVYIAECSSPQQRGMLVTIYQLLITLGMLVSTVIGGLLSTAFNGWRYMLGLAAVPSFLQFVGFLFMPESPRWLTSQRRYGEALKVLYTMRGSIAESEQEMAAMKMNFEERERVMQEQQAISGGRPLFVQVFSSKPIRRALFVGCCLQAIQQLTGINTVMYYSATIIRMAGVRDESQAIWLSAITASVNSVFTLIGIYLVERAGRRKLVLFSFVGIIASLLLLGIGFELMSSESPLVTRVVEEGKCGISKSCYDCIGESQGCGFCFVQASNGTVMEGSCWKLDGEGEKPLDGPCADKAELLSQYPSHVIFANGWCPNKYAWVTILAMGLYLVSFAPGMGPMPWTINAELYPLWARGFCTSISTSFSWGGNLIISSTFLSLLESLSKPGVFYLYAGIALFGLVLFWCTLPETRGCSLEDVENLFAGEWFSIRGCGHGGNFLGSNNVQYVHIRGLNRASPRASSRPGEFGVHVYNSDDSDN